MPVSEDVEQRLKVDVMRAGLGLEQKQPFWETPRNIVVLLVVVSGIAAVVGFMWGQTLAQNAQPQQIIIRFEPGSIVAPPTPAK